MPIHESERHEPAPVDAAVQAQVALRLLAGLFDHLVEKGLMEPGAAARIAESAARLAEAGDHSQRAEIAEALRRIIVA
ncbi:hypothetical protein [Phenylobacterium sp.]|uniref:hypothetical protein n=1 Tax=Phenylobacterium sp. TaxID=1871053 RepID=UPI0035B2885A